MEYNESYFKKSANRKVMLIWVLIASILTIAYGIEYAKGGRELGYVLAFIAICWIPIVLSFIVVKIKGWENVNLSLGTEVELSCNFVAKGFHAMPTVAAKWTF